MPKESPQSEDQIKLSVNGNLVHVEKNLFRRLSQVLSEHSLEAEIIGGVVVFGAIAGVTAKVIHDRHERGKTKVAPKLSEEQLAEYNLMFAEHYDKIAGYLNFRCPDPSRAEELTQEVFLRAYNNFYPFTPQPGLKNARLTWLFGIARHLNMNEHRDTSRHGKQLSIDQASHNDEEVSPYDTLPSHEPDVEKQVIHRQEERKFQTAVSQLIPNYQLVIYLKSLDLKNDEIAEIFNSTENAIKSLYFRATQELEKKMNKLK
jgi:RNA polymerase sigma-70 factor, ECF subfamily